MVQQTIVNWEKKPVLVSKVLLCSSQFTKPKAKRSDEEEIDYIVDAVLNSLEPRFVDSYHRFTVSSWEIDQMFR